MQSRLFLQLQLHLELLNATYGTKRHLVRGHLMRGRLFWESSFCQTILHLSAVILLFLSRPKVRGQFPQHVPVNPQKVLELWDYEGSLTHQVRKSLRGFEYQYCHSRPFPRPAESRSF